MALQTGGRDVLFRAKKLEIAVLSVQGLSVVYMLPRQALDNPTLLLWGQDGELTYSEDENAAEPLKTIRLEQIKSVGQTQKESSPENVMEITMADRVLLVKSEMEGMCDQLTAWQKCIVAAVQGAVQGNEPPSQPSKPLREEKHLLESLRKGQVFAMSSVMNKWLNFKLRASVDAWRRNCIADLTLRQAADEKKRLREEAEANALISSVRSQITAMGERSPVKATAREGNGRPSREPRSAGGQAEGVNSEEACQQAFHGAAAMAEGSGGVTVSAMLEYILGLDPARRPKGLGSISSWKESEMQKGLQSCANADGLIDYEDFGSWWRTWDF